MEVIVRRLLIVGTGGQGKVVLECAKRKYKSITFMTNDINSPGISGYPIIYEQNTSMDYMSKNYDEIIVAIGNNKDRLKLMHEYIGKGIKGAIIIHPKAVVSESVEIGEGTVVFANAVINPYAKIGLGCIINTGAIIEHDCIIKDGVHISPNAAMGGAVIIGEKTWVCIGSSIANNIKIGTNVIVGAGSVVLKDVPDNVLVAGIPAVIKRKI
jgi:sugar O-acyltransferase (sialic acid O-acetyltransferase NeuD family)